MKIDEYNRLFESMQISDDAYDNLVEAALKKHRRKRRRHSAWFVWAAAGMPVFAVICLVVIIRMPWFGQQGAMMSPAMLETTTQAPSTTAAEVPPTVAAAMPVPGERAHELFAISGIVPQMDIVQKQLVNIAVETYFEQYEQIQTLCQELAGSDISKKEAEVYMDVCSLMEIKPETFYYMRRNNEALPLLDLNVFLTQKFGDIKLGVVYKGNNGLAVSELMNLLRSFAVAAMQEESVYLLGEKVFSMGCAEGLTAPAAVVIEASASAHGGWFFYEFAPSKQGTMVVSAGYCPAEIAAVLLDGTLENLGYMVEKYAYNDLKWGISEE